MDMSKITLVMSFHVNNEIDPIILVKNEIDHIISCQK